MTNLDNNSFSAKTTAELFENTKNINSAEILGLLFLNKNISEENLKHNYKMAYSILEKERIKSIDYLKNAIKSD